jgi:hypothetical protein
MLNLTVFFVSVLAEEDVIVVLMLRKNGAGCPFLHTPYCCKTLYTGTNLQLLTSSVKLKERLN